MSLTEEEIINKIKTYFKYFILLSNNRKLLKQEIKTNELKSTSKRTPNQMRNYIIETEFAMNYYAKELRGLLNISQTVQEELRMKTLEIIRKEQEFL
jgi:hypothetical protein